MWVLLAWRVCGSIGTGELHWGTDGVGRADPAPPAPARPHPARLAAAPSPGWGGRCHPAGGAVRPAVGEAVRVGRGGQSEGGMTGSLGGATRELGGAGGPVGGAAGPRSIA